MRKSTLFMPERAEVLFPSKMFATLDPTIRACGFPSNRRVLVSDTWDSSAICQKVC